MESDESCWGDRAANVVDDIGAQVEEEDAMIVRVQAVVRGRRTRKEDHLGKIRAARALQAVAGDFKDRR
jgi:hypothetical protein